MIIYSYNVLFTRFPYIIICNQGINLGRILLFNIIGTTCAGLIDRPCVHNSHNSGYIDLGSAGLADRWEDIAMAHRSLRCNFGGVFGGKVYPDFDPDWLFEELGIPFDAEKFRFYDLLHELY